MDLELVTRALVALELPHDTRATVGVTAAAFLVCLALTNMLPRAWTLETRSRVTSTLHAIVSTTLAVRTFFEVMALPRTTLAMYPAIDATAHGEAMWLTHMPAARFAVAVTLGYIIFDSALGLAFPDLLDLPMIVHHSLVIGACVSGLRYDVGIIYMALLLVNEASTPFVNVHFVFKHWKDWRRGVNGLGMWLSYFLCRLVVNAAIGYSMFFCTTPRSLTIAPGLIISQLLMFTAAQGAYAGDRVPAVVALRTRPNTPTPHTPYPHPQC